METEVLVALVTSGLSLASSALALAINTRSEHRSKDLEQSLAKLSIEEERRRKAYELASTEASPVEQACEKLWSLIQAFKNEVGALGEVTEFSEIPGILEAADSAREQYRSAYNELAPKLGEVTPAAHGALHTVGKVFSLMHRIEGIDDPRNALSSLRSDHIQDSLSSAHKTLTQYQLAISSHRMAVRQQRLEYLLAILGGYKPEVTSAKKEPNPGAVPAKSAGEPHSRRTT